MNLTGSDHVWLDARHLSAGFIEQRFPTIVSFCRGYGLDPSREKIPVAPAAHYLMGGVRTDGEGRTSLPGLFACGEVACTGVHGANRLASNSLLEGLVFSRRAVAAVMRGEATAADPTEGIDLRRPVEERSLQQVSFSPPAYRAMALAMWEGAGLERSAESLRYVEDILERRSDRAKGEEVFPDGSEPEELEVTNLHLLARLTVESAALREESRGAHFRIDFPKSDPAWQGHLVISRTAGVAFVPTTPEMSQKRREVSRA
jgi:L-aspartate oxidase